MTAVAATKVTIAKQPVNVSLLVLAALALALPVLAFVSRDAGQVILTEMVLLVLVTAAGIDLQTSRVPNLLIYPALAFTLAGTALVQPPFLDEALIGGGVTFGAMFLVALLGRGMLGMGDVKVAALIGCTLGWLPGLVALGAGLMIGSVVAVGLVAAGKKGRKDFVPLVPFFLVGAILAYLFWGALVGELTPAPDHFALLEG